jgi:hypothetical protein
MNNRTLLFKWAAAAVRRSGWAPALLFICYLIISLVFNGYVLYPPLDIPTHFMGGVALSFFYLDAVENSQEFIGRVPRLLQAPFVFTALTTTAVFWEFYEFASDYLIGTQLQHGVADTCLDLFFGMLGSFTFLTSRGIANSIRLARKGPGHMLER